MSILNTSLFATNGHRKIGVGFHNVGSGVLRASNEAMVKKVEAHYGERCGHIPLDYERTGVLVGVNTVDIQNQMGYLSQLFGIEMKAFTAGEVTYKQKSSQEQNAIDVPNDKVTESITQVAGD